MQKVKSHRSFGPAANFEDLWTIAGNFCADAAATSAFKSLPCDIRNLSDSIAEHASSEKNRLSRVFEYLAAFNRHRCEALSQLPQKEGCPSTMMQIAKCPPQATEGKFPSNLMGEDAVAFMRDFNPTGYETLHFAVSDESPFMMCLQGANVAKAVVLWLQALKWPPDLDVVDASDWGISWFELAVSFYFYTGYRFPVKVGGAGNKSRYVDYGSDEALILPWHQRAAILQGICLRNMIQNLSTVTEQRIFPDFGTFKCRTLTRLGLKGVVARIPRRPVLPNTTDTINFVAKYMSNLTGIALNEPIYYKDLIPMMVFDRIHEPTAAQRHNLYASFMTAKRKSRAAPGIADDN